jgi:nucleotide-binding universal stress UspA family protein
MSSGFRNILIPADFSSNTDLAVRKAMEMAGRGRSVFHLLHVLDQSKKWSRHFAIGRSELANEKYLEWEAEKKLSEWRSFIEAYNPEIEVNVYLEKKRSTEQVITRRARQCAADLIVIGKKNNHSWTSLFRRILPSRIARNAGCAVLTVKQGALNQKIRTLVVPVTDKMAVHKMEAIRAICMHSRIRIHLVSFVNRGQTPEQQTASTLLLVYQRLRASVHCPVEYSVLHGSNKAKSILNYAEKVHADILLVHPQSESRIDWLNRHISDVLPCASRVQVLTVQPDLI